MVRGERSKHSGYNTRQSAGNYSTRFIHGTKVLIICEYHTTNGLIDIGVVSPSTTPYPSWRMVGRQVANMAYMDRQIEHSS